MSISKEQLKKLLLDYKGRMSRAPFIIISLSYLFSYFFFFFLFMLLFPPGLSQMLFWLIRLFLFYGFIVIIIKRLHDLNQSGWLSLLVLLPLINILFLIYLFCVKSSNEANQYGLPDEEASHEEQDEKDLSSVSDPYERLMAEQGRKSNKEEDPNSI